ncbi:MAG: hypothetical protein QME74_03630, partial [Candidatus Edwardsbacteria bacterium]|nr:hypothetical protein [Candidatus Edwardsbacteria bacterium]
MREELTMRSCDDEKLKTEFVLLHFHRIQHFKYLFVFVIQPLEFIGSDVLAGFGEFQPRLGFSR